MDVWSLNILRDSEKQWNLLYRNVSINQASL